MPPVCSFFLEGQCNRGANCHYRHSGQGTLPKDACTTLPSLPILTAIGIPLATAFASLSIAAPEYASGGVTARLEGGLKVKFNAGALPVKVDFQQPVTVDFVETALEITWYKPTRNVWLQYKSEDDARQAKNILDGSIVKQQPLKATIVPSRSGELWSIQISSITSAIDNDDLVAILPPELHPKAIRSGNPIYDLNTDQFEVLKKTIAGFIKCETHPQEPIEHKNALKRKFKFTFSGAPDLSTVARQVDGLIIVRIPMVTGSLLSKTVLRVLDAIFTLVHALFFGDMC